MPANNRMDKAIRQVSAFTVEVSFALLRKRENNACPNTPIMISSARIIIIFTKLSDMNMLKSIKQYLTSLDYKAFAGVLVLLFLFAKLGFWQLDRADEKKALLTQYQTRLYQAPINIANLHGLEDINLTQVVTKGMFDNRHHFLLDNKVYNKQVGYHVITPMAVSHSGRLILVDRGWVPANMDRSILPEIPAIKGTLDIKATVMKNPGNFTLKIVPQGRSKWPMRIQDLDLEHLNRISKEPLQLDYMLRLSGDSIKKYGFTPNWTVINVKPEKHYGYAFQWFTMAVAIFLIGLIRSIKTFKRRRTGHCMA